MVSEPHGIQYIVFIIGSGGAARGGGGGGILIRLGRAGPEGAGCPPYCYILTLLFDFII